MCQPCVHCRDQKPPVVQPSGYAPSVGDRFYKPAGIYKNPITGEKKPTPEQSAEVTMVSPGHVVAMINGLEYTLPRGEFIKLALKTLDNGATLTRHSA
jgi:hypothetical protein